MGVELCANLQVIDFKSPGEIQQMIDLKLYNDGTDDDTILALCRKVLEYSVHTGMNFIKDVEDLTV